MSFVFADFASYYAGATLVCEGVSNTAASLLGLISALFKNGEDIG
jgi:hypothetical protein